jgi:hypothetical protein
MRELDATGTADYKYRIVRPDGEVRWVHDRKQLIYDEEGKVLRKGGLVTDITEARVARKSATAWNPTCVIPKKWRPSARLPAASPTTSTTC